jgi:hypothetical protein
MIRALVLALLFVASPLDASSRRVRIDSARYADAWARVQACAQRAPLPGHSLAQLVVLRVPALAIDGHSIYARWLPGDTIFVTPSVSDTGWVIRHELLHALLNGPAGNDKHPRNPFEFPCKAMEFMNVPGGIMGAHLR